MQLLVGYIIGLASALVVVYWQARLDRKHRRADYERMLHTEISRAKQGLQDYLSEYDIEERRNAPQQPKRRRFTRIVYQGCIGSLGLLAHETRTDIQDFYADLEKIEDLVFQTDNWMGTLKDKKRRHSEFIGTAKNARDVANQLLAKLRS